jgi:titin
LLSWTEEDDDIFLYRITASENSNLTPAIQGGLKSAFDGNTTAVFDFLNADIKFNTQYFFAVRALRGGQFSGFSATVNITTGSGPIASPPLITNIVVSGSTVTYTLVNTHSSPVTLFADFNSNPTTQRGTPPTPPNVAVQVSQSFTSSDSTIFARATSTVQANSPVVSEKFAEDEVPAAPNIGANDIVVNAGFNFINYTYETTDPIVDGFVVERDPGFLDVAGFSIVSPQLPPSARRFLDTAVSSAVEYTYRIRAFNRVGSTLSNTRTVTAVSTVPSAPSNLTEVGTLQGGGEGDVTISWQRNSTDEDGFLVQRKLSSQGAGSYATVGGTPKGQTNFRETVIGDPDFNTDFDYRIIAYNQFGNSTPSDAITVTIDA